MCVCTLYYTMDICLHDKFRHIEKKVGLVTASHLIYGERVDGKTLNAIISTFSKGVVPLLRLKIFKTFIQTTRPSMM